MSNVIKSWMKPHAKKRLAGGCCMNCANPKGPDGTSTRCRQCADRFNQLTKRWRQKRAGQQQVAIPPLRVPRLKAFRHPALDGFSDFLAQWSHRQRQNINNRFERILVARNDGMTRMTVNAECVIERKGQ